MCSQHSNNSSKNPEKNIYICFFKEMLKVYILDLEMASI